MIFGDITNKTTDKVRIRNELKMKTKEEVSETKHEVSYGLIRFVERHFIYYFSDTNIVILSS